MTSGRQGKGTTAEPVVSNLFETKGALDGSHETLGVQVVDLDGSRFRDLGRVFVLAAQLLHGDSTTSNHSLLGLADPDTRIVKLLVGCIRTVGVSNLSLQIVVLFLLEFTESIPVGPLGIGIDIHLDHTVDDGSLDFFVGRTTASVHDQEDGLVGSTSQLFLGVGLMLAKTLRLKSNISGLVDTMDISKGSGNGKHASNFGEPVINSVDLLRAGVELLRVN